MSLKDSYLKSRSQDWDQAVKSIQELLTWDRASEFPDRPEFREDRYVEEDEAIRRLTFLLMTVPWETLWKAFLFEEKHFRPYPTPQQDPYSRMEFVSHFVWHEILDDGCPGLGYHIQTSLNVTSRVLSHKDAPDKGRHHLSNQRYFCQDLYWLRTQVPNSQGLSAQSAVEVLEALEEGRIQSALIQQKMGFYVSEDSQVDGEGKTYSQREMEDFMAQILNTQEGS